MTSKHETPHHLYENSLGKNISGHFREVNKSKSNGEILPYVTKYITSSNNQATHHEQRTANVAICVAVTDSRELQQVPSLKLR